MKKTFAFLAAAGVAAIATWQSLEATPAPAPEGNQPPVCCFGPACQQTGSIDIVKCGGATTTVSLDASASYDPEGEPLSFFWSSCPNSTLTDPNAPITDLIIDTSADCSRQCGVRLVVSDGEKMSFCRLFVRVLDNEAICPTKPRQIEYLYTGEDCTASNFVQDPAGVSCVGDPFFASPVRILVTKANGPRRVYFDGIVELGDTFVADGAGQPSGKVPPNTRIQIFDMNDNLLQQTIFHTSCSQPLEVGDQFGASIITDFTP